MRRISAAVLAAALVGSTVAVLSAPAAQAAGGTRIPLSGFSDIVADPAHHHEFISGGQGVNGVVVAKQDGTIQTTLAGLPGAAGMVLSADGSTLFVALENGDGIGEIDTATLAVTKVSTGAATCPSSVAYDSGTLWFGYGCDGGSPAVGSLDVATGVAHLGVIGLTATAALASSPQAPGVLLVATVGQSPDFLSRYTVTGGDTPTASATATINVGGNFGDMAFTPSGADVIVADGGVYHHQVYSTADLSADGTYTTDSYPNAVSVNADGLVAAGIDGIYGPDIWIYHPGATSASKKFDFGSGNYLSSGGLAFTGTHVYAVTSNFGAPYTLRVLSTLPPAPMTITANKTAFPYGARARLTVHLTSKDPNKNVSIYATPINGTRVLVHRGTVNRSGQLTTAFKVTRRTTFTAVYSGGTTYSPGQKAVKVAVHARVAETMLHEYGTSHGFALYHVRQNPYLLVTVLPNHYGGCVTLQAQRAFGGHWRSYPPIGCAALSANSQQALTITGTHAVGERVRLRAVWGGDRLNAAQTGAWAYARFTR